MRLPGVFLLIGFTAASAFGQFKPPNEKQRLDAIGPVNSLPKTERLLFSPGSAFQAITPPGPSDWLAQHRERGQPYTRYIREKPNKPNAKRKTLYVLPLGDFPEAKKILLTEMVSFGSIYFGLDVVQLPPTPIGKQFTTRQNGFTGNPQILSTDVLTYLKKRVSQDAYCLIAVTMTDLYPDPKWNFVFGQASLRDRVGVYSFARYDPEFPKARPESPVTPRFLERALKVFAHETGHMFGMAHCIYFNCLMNGSNHLQESDRKPIHLCPVCLRKLSWNTGLDPLARYDRLAQYYGKTKLDAAKDWVHHRQRNIRADVLLGK